MGRANAGAVVDAGADSLWWNPASIGGSGREAYVGVVGRTSSVSLTNAGSTLSPPGQAAIPVGGDSRVGSPEPDLVSPTVAVVVPLTDRLTVGLSASEPYRLHNDLPATAFSRYDTIRSRIETDAFQGVVGVRVADGLNLGAAVEAQRTRAALVYASPNLAPGVPDGRLALSGHGWNFGWSAGLRWTEGPFSLAASYRSVVKHDLAGTIALSGLAAPLDTANFTAPASFGFNSPWMASVGGRWAVLPQLSLSAQADRIGWSRYDAVHLAFGGQSQAIPQQYRDVTRLSLGAEYMLDPRLVLRAGLAWDPTPTPADAREAGVPDADQTVYAAGLTVALVPNAKIDAAVSYAHLARTALNHDLIFYPGTPAQTTGRLQGWVDGGQFTAGAALRIEF